jgi:nitrous oxidase accessory protein NosD
MPSLVGTGAVRRVSAGESIQRAVDVASPGDIIQLARGVYRENVSIHTRALTIRGPATLVPPAKATPTLCDPLTEGNATSGVCVSGDSADDVRVSGLTIRAFPGSGVVVAYSAGAVVDHDSLIGNRRYGLYARGITGASFHHDLASSNGDAGVYIGLSPSARAVVLANRTMNNRDPGILVRSSSAVQVARNVSQGNCAGVLLVGHAPGPLQAVSVTGNRLVSNDHACSREPEDYIPAISGVGVGLIGSDDSSVAGNIATGNGSRSAGIAAGLVVRRSLSGNPSSADVISGNRASSNAPADLVWDGTGNPRFFGNRCQSSTPPHLCH